LSASAWHLEQAGEPGGRLAGTAQLAHLPPPGAGAGSLEEHISLTELVNGGEVKSHPRFFKGVCDDLGHLACHLVAGHEQRLSVPPCMFHLQQSFWHSPSGMIWRCSTPRLFELTQAASLPLQDAVTMAAAGVAPPAAAAPAEAEEPGRKKRKGTSVKSKP